MAKVIPGPVVQRVRGALGGVVYYQQLGKTIARARVQPHQIQTGAREYWRSNFRRIMRFWNIVAVGYRQCWMQAAAPQMYGYSLFLRDSSDGGEIMPHVWPHYLLADFPQPDVCREIANERWKITWDPQGYPGAHMLLFHTIRTPWLALGHMEGSYLPSGLHYIDYVPYQENYLVVGVCWEDFLMLPQDARQWTGRLWSDTPECT